MSENIERLPKWARERIETLTRQRETAVNTLREFTDAQTPTQFYCEEAACLADGGPAFLRRYITADSITCEWNGIRLRIAAHNHARMDGGGISLQWEMINRRDGEAAMIPHSFCKVRLVHVKETP